VLCKLNHPRCASIPDAFFRYKGCRITVFVLAGFLDGENFDTQQHQAVSLRQTLNAIEAAKYSPTLELAFRIAEVFGVPLDEVFQLVGSSD